MRKLILHFYLIAILVYISSCNDTRMQPLVVVDTNGNKVEAARLMDVGTTTTSVEKDTALVLCDTSLTYFYEYVEVINKGERGTFKSKKILHKGDYLSMDFINGDSEENDVIVQVVSEAKIIKEY